MPSTQVLDHCLKLVHSTFERHGIWHCLGYGQLLGAVRDGELVPWDDDIDLLIRPADVDRIIALNLVLAKEGMVLHEMCLDPSALAVNPGGVQCFTNSTVAISFQGEKVGDLYAFSLFEDGVLRRYDFAREVYWCPHSSFPHFFVEELEEVELGGRRYPGPRSPERWLESVYGPDWRTPYRAARLGGNFKPGVTIHGDRYEPTLKDDTAWCEARGWDRSRYEGQRSWPRPVAGAGPIGPTERTRDTTRSLWWRSLDELAEHF